jgi:hypothetical protein
MVALQLRALLNRHKSSDTDCARSLVEDLGTCELSTLEDAFTVSIRTGVLDHSRARRLLALVEQLSADETALTALTDRTTDLSMLRAETDELAGRRRDLERRSEAAAALQLKLDALSMENAQSAAEAAGLRRDIEEMTGLIARLNTIVTEVQE